MSDFLIPMVSPSKDSSFKGVKIGQDLATPKTIQVPTCKACHESMSLICTIDDPNIIDKPTLIFQCCNDPGMCEDWSPEEGGNCVLSHDALSEESSPNEVLIECVSIDVSEEDLENEDYGYFDILCDDERFEHVLGKVHGQPMWLQGEETPDCCSKPMTFTMQFSECGDINLGGGGIGYLFSCDECQDNKFLWQC